MKTILIALLTLTCTAFADTGPEPDPWWLQVEKWQGLFLKWIAALTVMFGALAAFFGMVIMRIRAIINHVDAKEVEAKERMDRQSAAIETNKQHIVDVAVAIAPPPKPGPVEVIAPAGEPLKVVETKPKP